MRALLAPLLLLAATGCGALPAPLPSGSPPRLPLAARIDALLAEPPFAGAQWGILAIDAATGDTLYARNSGTRFIPASSVKLPLAGAALALLGPDFRWETSFHAAAPIVDGVVEGDLLLRASGDPTLGPPFLDPVGAPFVGLLDALGAAGIRGVEGGLVLDASPWDSTTVPPSWMIEDLPTRDGATGGIFALHDGVLRIRLRGSNLSGEAAAIDWSPWEGGDFVENGVRTGPAGVSTAVSVGFLPESRRWVASGTIAPGDTLTLEVAQRDPVRLAFDALSLALEEGGVRVEGEGRILWEVGLPMDGGCFSGALASCAGARGVATVHSPPLAEVIPRILGETHNWTAEQLLRTLGAEVGSAGSVEGGARVIARFLEGEVGVDSLDYRLRDGSGLSTQNLLTPRALVALLRHAGGAPWGELFREALAEPGEAEATLGTRLLPLRGRLHAKTGTLTNVGALSGYLAQADGGELVFAILVNGSNLPGGALRAQIDRVVEALALP